jgi:hypothetical protein
MIVDRRIDALTVLRTQFQASQSRWDRLALARRMKALEDELQGTYTSMLDVSRGWVFLSPDRRPS